MGEGIQKGRIREDIELLLCLPLHILRLQTPKHPGQGSLGGHAGDGLHRRSNVHQQGRQVSLLRASRSC